MKICVKNPCGLRVLVAVVGSMVAGPLPAQTFKTLHSFTDCSVTASGDGCSPVAALILSSNTLYGTTVVGGSSGNGTVFKLNTDGTGFKTLHSFIGSDGRSPRAALILSSNTLYGTTRAGGSSGDNGAVFAINTDGTGFTNLYSFTGGGDGLWPGGLVLMGNTLFGTASGGGLGYGTLFGLNTDGSAFTVLYGFSGTDGNYPTRGSLTLKGNILYGTTEEGGNWGSGTVFKINTDGSGFTNIYSFTDTDGAVPRGGVILSGNTLYGATWGGGSSGLGTVFKLNTEGTGFTNLYSFSVGVDVGTGWTNSDGGAPWGSLILSGDTLYGTASAGGSFSGGTVFALKTDGTGFSVLHAFTLGSDGWTPVAGLIQSGNTLYGTAQNSASHSGTVFSISLPVSHPQLTIAPANGYVILSWPTNFVGFTLQSATNLVPPAICTSNLPAPVVVNGQNAVTNPISSTQQFYRLIK